MKKNILIATNAQKVLHFLIDHPVKELLESEIQRATKISKSGVNYALSDLVAANFISRTKRGKAFFYTLKHKSLIVKQLKIIETLTQLNPLLKKLEPLTSKIILFGSASRGENTLDSDIDLLILTEYKKEVRKIVAEYKTVDVKYQAIIQDHLEYVSSKKEDDVFHSQVKKGITIWKGRPVVPSKV
jgi:predicted nucleotidyltransferase